MRRFVYILVFILAVCSCSMSQEQKVYLVSVGISDYPGRKNDLRLPEADAKVIAEIYDINSNAETALLLNGDATKANIVSTMRRVYGRARSNDVVVFFFSGHGLEQGGFVAYDDELTYDEVRRAFSSCRAKHKVIFADACFSGKIRSGSSQSVSAKPKMDIMLFLSSRNNEVSYERTNMKNGFYTTCLARCLRGGADVNKDRRITAKELYDAVSEGVIRLSGGKQHPVMWGSFDDDMPVMIW